MRGAFKSVAKLFIYRPFTPIMDLDQRITDFITKNGNYRVKGDYALRVTEGSVVKKHRGIRTRTIISTDAEHAYKHETYEDGFNVDSTYNADGELMGVQVEIDLDSGSLCRKISLPDYTSPHYNDEGDTVDDAFERIAFTQNDYAVLVRVSTKKGDELYSCEVVKKNKTVDELLDGMFAEFG